MKKFFITTALLCLLFPYSAAQEFTGVYAPYPPFVDGNREDNGIFAAVLDEVLANHGDSAQYLEIPWTLALSSVKASQYDFVAGIWFNSEREKHYIFSEPILYNRVVFISRKSDPFDFNGLRSLDGKRIGLIREYNYGDIFLNYGSYEREELASLLSLLKLVRFEGVDMTLEDEVVAREEMRVNAPELLDLLYFSKTPFSENGLRVACGRANPECPALIERINKSLAEMSNDGRLQALYQRLGI